MGKKSKKNKGAAGNNGINAADKKTHKEKVQERRARVEEALKEEEEKKKRERLEESIEVFDRVWYRVPGNESRDFQRGTVMAIDDTSDGLSSAYHILPIDVEAQDGDKVLSQCHIVVKGPPESTTRETHAVRGLTFAYDKVKSENILKDEFNWEPQFDIGEKVMVFPDEDYRWQPAVVSGHWITKGNDVHPYQYTLENPPAGSNPRGLLPRDDDGCIVPNKRLRFAVGDHALVNFEFVTPHPSTRTRTSKERWVTAAIRDLQVTNPSEHFIDFQPYEVEILTDRGQPEVYYVNRDNDEHIFRVDAEPRERLMNAIESNCSYGYINYLVIEFELDCTIFLDLFLAKAIEYGSYNALLWLQENIPSVTLDAIKDEEGNGYVHQIVQGEFATRFFQCHADACEVTNHCKKLFLMDIDIIHTDRAEDGMPGRNTRPLLCDIIKDKPKIFSCILERGVLQALDLHTIRRDNKVFEDDFRKQLSTNQRKMLSELADTSELERFSRDFKCLGIGDLSSRVDVRQQLYRMISAEPRQVEKSIWRRLVRHIRFFEPESYINRIFGKLLQYGLADMVRNLVDIDGDVLKLENRVQCDVDCFEYTQPESLQENQDLGFVEMLGAVDIATHGPALSLRRRRVRTTSTYSKYIMDARRTYVSHRPVNYAKFFMGLASESSNDWDGDNNFWERKVRLLKDDEYLPERLEVLRYLVSERGLQPPSPIDAIRWRQCGVLRWLVQQGYVNLQAPANKLPPQAKTPTFHEKQPVRKEITVGEYLAFAAVEYDDLQTLQWLVSVKSVAIQKTICEGWNILHTCAFFGRVEIAHWLVASEKLNDMLKVPSKRKPTKYFASHLAVDRGFTFLADLLLDWGCPSIDTKGKELYQMAKQSSYAHVQEWGSAIEKPLGLEKDMQDLYRLLGDVSSSTDEVVAFILKTECLSSSRWKDAGAVCCHSCIKLDMSAASVLQKCCSFGDAALVTWLCTKLLTADNIQDALFWQAELPTNMLLPREKFHWRSFGIENEMDTLQEIIGQSWASDISIDDPMELFPPMRQLWINFENECDIRRALEVVRRRLVLSSVLKIVVKKGMKKLQKQLTEGEMVKFVQGTIDVIRATARHHALHCFGNGFEFTLRHVLSSDGHLLVDTNIFGYNDFEYPFISHLMARINYESENENDSFYLVAASEGYDDLLQWSLCGGGQGWDVEKEIAVTRISAYRGHKQLTRILILPTDDEISFQSSVQERLQAAIVGAAESGRVDDLELYLDKIYDHGGLLPDPLLQSTTDVNTMAVSSSFIGTALCWCLTDSHDPLVPRALRLDDPDSLGPAILSFVKNKCGYSDKDILHAFNEMLGSCLFDVQFYDRGVGLILCLCNSLGLDVWDCCDEIKTITERYIEEAERNSDEGFLKATRHVLEVLLKLGLSIQHVHFNYYGGNKKGKHKFGGVLKDLQAQQRTVWSRLDPIKKGATLNDIQTAMNSGQLQSTWYDSQGLRLVHLAAAYNRKDVLQWLVENQLASIDDKDCLGRSVLQVAHDSNAAICASWIMEAKAAKVIYSFLSSIIRCREDMQRKRKILNSIVWLQARVRGYATRGTHRAKLLANMEEAQRFQGIWAGLLACFESNRASAELSTWANLKSQVDDMAASFGITESDLFDTVKLMDEAGKLSLVEPEKDRYEAVHGETPDIWQTEGEDVNKLSSGSFAQETTSTASASGQELFDKILLTKEVIKWLRVADNKYREFFVRRAGQLARGDRSRILAKRLTGSKTTIYETYLEQKSGFRILWTEKNNGCLLIWYVSKHDAVSRLMGLIDDAESRSTRQLTSAREALGNDGATVDSYRQCSESDLVMLDPRGHTPLKLYSVGYDELDRLVDDPWKPPLHLTDSEREVVECKGTTLLLGRSGTGKTCCISNRMDYDRYLAGNQECFSQLFVARSRRLRDYVESVVGEGSDTSKAKSEFTTFQTLIQQLEHSVRSAVNDTISFLPSQHVDFHRFRRDIWKPTMGIDALICWTSIRSFIKGSIEAVAGRQPLSQEAYLSLGKKRCRLSEEQRIAVYNVFQKYNAYCSEGKLWDDCDRISILLSALSKLEQASPLDFLDIQYNKLYVDEVQDYTQAEITLFFRLCGPAGLFLAGDPAQAVVEGVEFRFEDIRSVGHYLFEQDRKFIPDKPKIVNVNFRSHTGVLGVAAGILEHLFGAFPDSAKQLSKDRGLFTGPRPSVLHKIELVNVKELVAKLEGAVIITHDAVVSNLKERLGYPLVYGVREAKGLEFETVIVLDFYKLLPAAAQKPFRDLLLGRQVSDVGTTCPEIEGYLKLLYTGVTRCIQRLLFAETARSPSGDAFVRWLTSSTAGSRSKDDALAVRQTVDDIEAMSRTPDEWKSLGLENAIHAEETPDMDESLNWLEKAIYCFGKAGLTDLARKARAHKQSVGLRNEIYQFGSSEDVENQRVLIELEMETARVSEVLVSGGLSSETKKLFACLLPLLSDYSRTKLQGAVLSKLA